MSLQIAVPAGPRYSEITNQVRVTVVPEPLKEHSDPGEARFVFAYHIELENLGTQPVKLVSRHWKIFSGNTQTGDVVGEGVVGMQPRLMPGGRFQYQSSAVISEQLGSMSGTYTFESDDGASFEVTIPQFDLVFDFVLH